MKLRQMFGILLIGALLGLVLACAQERGGQERGGTELGAAQAAEPYAVVKSASEWKRILPPESFHVMREQGTERPFGNAYDHNKADGLYYCRACGQKLFDSRHKFDSGTGWPSFYQPAEKRLIGTKTDHDIGMARTEVHCSRCGGHLGHVFDDGPKPTGLRYCMNSASLNFKARNAAPPTLLK